MDRFRHRQLPNVLTLLRLVLAAVFFVVLNQYRYDVGPADRHPWALLAAIAIFILAALTDTADGYLARRWEVESTFGRIMDPFCDKILIIGAFIYLAGPRFVDPAVYPSDPARETFFAAILPGNMVTGVYPWMVVVILARELLVTGIRGELEGQGVRFGANWSGKLKMILQSIAIPVVLLLVHLDPNVGGHGWMVIVRNALVYATVAATALSGVPYINSAVRVMRSPPM